MSGSRAHERPAGQMTHLFQEPTAVPSSQGGKESDRGRRKADPGPYPPPCKQCPWAEGQCLALQHTCALSTPAEVKAGLRPVQEPLTHGLQVTNGNMGPQGPEMVLGHGVGAQQPGGAYPRQASLCSSFGSFGSRPQARPFHSPVLCVPT